MQSKYLVICFKLERIARDVNTLIAIMHVLSMLGNRYTLQLLPKTRLLLLENRSI